MTYLKNQDAEVICVGPKCSNIHKEFIEDKLIKFYFTDSIFVWEKLKMGCFACNTRYVTWCNEDDFVLNPFINKAELILQNSDFIGVDAYACKFDEGDASFSFRYMFYNHLITARTGYVIKGDNPVLRFINNQSFFSGNTFHGVFRKEVFEEGINWVKTKSLDIGNYGDKIFFFYLLARGEVKYLDQLGYARSNDCIPLDDPDYYPEFTDLKFDSIHNDQAALFSMCRLLNNLLDSMEVTTVLVEHFIEDIKNYYIRRNIYENFITDKLKVQMVHGDYISNVGVPFVNETSFLPKPADLAELKKINQCRIV